MLLPNTLDEFEHIVAIDFEFTSPPGELPSPICLVAHDIVEGRWDKWALDKLHSMGECPFDVGPTTLVVAHYATAEMLCFIALGWSLPVWVIDTFAEFGNELNPRRSSMGGWSLSNALQYFGLAGLDGLEKTDMRELAIRGGPFSDMEQQALLDYCASDVAALARLFKCLRPRIEAPYALLRGEYIKSVASMEAVGVPIDTVALRLLKQNWDRVLRDLVDEVDKQYGVYDETSFRIQRFAAFLVEKGIPWPRTERGSLKLDEDTFKRAARQFPELKELQLLRSLLGKMRRIQIAAGSDGRNRAMLSPFGSLTSRNQPSSTKFIFGASRWIRGLIKPEQGRAVAYIDWEQQEFGIAAALSGDPAMLAAYESGDPYLQFAKQTGEAPSHATKQTHPEIREQFKACVLAVQYGMTAHGLAASTGQPHARAQALLDRHRATYSVFWQWSEAVVEHAAARRELWTTFGWHYHAGPSSKYRTLQNFPMQANGAEMMRLACIRLTRLGVRVCCPVHDALLIEAPADEIDKVVELAREAMSWASRIVLDGVSLRTDAEIVRYPDRYMDKGGAAVWKRIWNLLGVDPDSLCADDRVPARVRTPGQSYVSSRKE